jgi:hypothetical protein
MGDGNIAKPTLNNTAIASAEATLAAEVPVHRQAEMTPERGYEVRE